MPENVKAHFPIIRFIPISSIAMNIFVFFSTMENMEGVCFLGIFIIYVYRLCFPSFL